MTSGDRHSPARLPFFLFALLAAGSTGAFANCVNFSGFAIFQCADRAFFMPPPDYDPNVYAVDPNGAVAHVSAVFWQIGFGNNLIGSGSGSSGTGMAGGVFNGNDSGITPIPLRDTRAAIGDPRIPAGSLCLSAADWDNAGVDGCCDDSRTALLANDADGILNPYYDVYEARSLHAYGSYSLDWQQDYPMAILLKNADGSAFAVAAVATASRGNTGGNGACNPGDPGTNPAACDFRSGFYNFRDVKDGLLNPTDPNRRNVIPWQATPDARVAGQRPADPNDPSSPTLVDLEWSGVTVYTDLSSRPTTNPSLGGGDCTELNACNSGVPTHDPTRAPGVGVGDISGRFGGLVRYVVEVADCSDPNFAHPLSSITTTATSLTGVEIPPYSLLRLRTLFGKIPETAAASQAACRLGKCGDLGFEVTVPRAGACGCLPTGPERCDGLDNNCDGQVDEGNPGGGMACDTGLPGVCAAGTTECRSGGLVCIQSVAPSAEVCNGLDDSCDGRIDENDPGGGVACDTGRSGECRLGITHCRPDPNVPLTSLQCYQLTVPDPNLPSPTDPNRNEDPNDLVADPMRPTLYPQPDVCNGKDDNCNGVVDDLSLGTFPTCGVGACLAIGSCDPEQTPPVICTPGSPSPEICNGIDDDCNGIIDDVTVTCGKGVCLRSGGCPGSRHPCVPGAPGPVELPGNSVDENCDGILACDPGLPWRNHGGFVQCVTREVRRLVAAHAITRKAGNELIRAALTSKVGRR